MRASPVFGEKREIVLFDAVHLDVVRELGARTLHRRNQSL